MAKKTKFTDEDKNILKSHEAIVDAIAAFLGTSCEVTLHSLEDVDHALIKIVNNEHTKRKPGHPLTDQGKQILEDFKASGKQDKSHYTTTSASGDPMRSLFTVITNKEKPIGLIGINYNMNTPLSEFISTFSIFNQNRLKEEHSEHSSAPTSVEEMIHDAVSEMITNISTNINIPNHEKNKYIVYGLYDKGIFDIKGSVIMVAKELKLSKFTIYSYIRELREKSK